MRVRVTEDTSFDFHGQRIELAAGTNVGSPLADYMDREGLPVDVTDPTLDPAAVVTAPDEVVLDWVGGDPERAALALTAEEQQDGNRTGLAADLAAVVEAKP